MDWDKLRIFHAVGEAGSFTKAGQALNLSQSAISRQIAALEDSLRAPLFHRHARGLILTEQGELLYSTVREIMSKLVLTEAMLSEDRIQAKGSLKVTTTVAFGAAWLTPRLADFVQDYPDITLTLLNDDRELNLAMREADVAVRLQPLRQPDLIHRHLAFLKLNLYASRTYIERFGEPQQIEDFKNHVLIGFPFDSTLPFPDANWLFELATITPHKKGRVVFINNMQAVVAAAKAGVGVAAIPSYLINPSDNLVRIMPHLKNPDVDAYLVYPEELRHSKRIAVFRDYLIKQIGEDKTLSEPPKRHA